MATTRETRRQKEGTVPPLPRASLTGFCVEIRRHLSRPGRRDRNMLIATPGVRQIESGNVSVNDPSCRDTT